DRRSGAGERGGVRHRPRRGGAGRAGGPGGRADPRRPGAAARGGEAVSAPMETPPPARADAQVAVRPGAPVRTARRTSTRLADGRELIYFDATPDAVRDVPDTRTLPPRPPASELRYDPLTEEWVAIAGHRQNRTFLPPAD